jgi:hypothetical protein
MTAAEIRRRWALLEKECDRLAMPPLVVQAKRRLKKFPSTSRRQSAETEKEK